MTTFEKGLSYNFMVERIAETRGNYYYVIVIDNKECWIKMLPFEIYQKTEKNIIRCEYRGVDSYGSHIFIEDKLSVLYELYKEKEEYDFNYVKESIDMEGTPFSVLKDKYGLVHRLYEQLPSNLKNKETPIKCRINSIDRKQKSLILQVAKKAGTDYMETNIQNANNVINIAWIDETILFKIINKEGLVKKYFYDIIYLPTNVQLKNIINLYQSKNNKWIANYIRYLDKTYKYILIQKENLDELAEFANLMIRLIDWARAFKLCEAKKLPKLKKYEGLQKAIEILQTNSISQYKETLICAEKTISEMSTLFALFEIDPCFFSENLSFYKETCKILYDSFSTSTPNEALQSIKDKCLKAFQGILAYRVKMERKRIVNNIVQMYELSHKIEEKINDDAFSVLYSLLNEPKNTNSQNIHSYIDMQPQVLSAITCIIYGYKLLENKEEFINLLSDIDKMLYFSEEYENRREEDEDFEVEDIEETEDNIYSSISSQTEIELQRNNFFLSLYEDGTYIITDKLLSENNIIKSISINPDIDKFVLQCYEHGSVNKIPVRVLQEKKREKIYSNGCYSQDCLKGIYVISEETYIATLSLYNNDTFIKLYSTEYISEHSLLGLKGN
ncbi:hypothetical protein, partial [uncultured Bacteroides sp.]